MYEDSSVMDKKNFSSLTPTSKCLTQEQSRSTSRQDGPGGSLLARKPQPRRRDSSLTSTNGPTLRMEATARKSTTPKGKILDKRPRPRLSSNPRQVNEDSESEINYIPTTGGKKQNFNHLLNFHFAPREKSSANLWRSFNTHPGGGWRSHSRPSHGNAMRPKFNKEHFLQANCQFMVKACGDYTVYGFDPDILVDWSMIEQINIRITGENPVCPICLSPPAGAKMTRCGHIFCWPCILHYLALSDKHSRSCPICYDLISSEDLKSVVATQFRDPEVGDEVSMQLMVRSRDSTKAIPLAYKDGAAFDWESSFSKLLLASPSEVLEKIIERERAELRLRLKEDEHCPEVCFIQQAMNHLAYRKKSLMHEFQDGSNFAQPETKSQNVSESSIGAQMGELDPVVRMRTESGESCSSEANCIDRNLAASKNLDIDGLSYFYQADDGQNIFLHPLNMAMFWKGLGPDPSRWPQIIKVLVVEKEPMTMSFEERKRYRFLRHLPVTTCFQLIEVELKTPMLSDDILKEFDAQLAQRRKRRVERVRKEKRREEFLEEEERKKHAPIPRPKIGSKLDFPACGTDEEFEGLQHALLASLAESPLENDNKDNAKCKGSSLLLLERSADLEVPVKRGESTSINLDYPTLFKKKTDTEATSSHMSFAQVASNPAVVKTLLPSSRATGHLTIKETSDKRHPDTEETDTDEYSVPNFRTSVSDAIAKALATHEGDERTSTGNSIVAQKKKGRKKGKVLFATGVGMGSN